MGLTKNEHDKVKDVLTNVDKNVGPGEAIALQVKFMALQTRLLSDIANELSGIERCLERIASRM